MREIHALPRARFARMIYHEGGLAAPDAGGAPERGKRMKKRRIPHATATVETRNSGLDGLRYRFHGTCEAVEFRVAAKAIEHSDSGIEHAEGELPPADLVCEQARVPSLAMDPHVIHHFNDSTR